MNYPLGTMFPISVNGKILSYEQRQGTLANLTMDKINSINYINPSKASQKYNGVPFGVIEITL